MVNDLNRLLSGLFKSPEQQVAEYDALYKQVFPLGREQKVALRALLKALCPAKKRKTEAQMFAYVSLAEGYLAAEESERPGVLRRWNAESAFLPEETRRVIAAALVLCTEMRDMADFPAEEAVLSLAKTVF